MTEQKKPLEKRQENLDKRRKRIANLRSKGVKTASNISVYDEAELSRIETESREEGGRAEIPMTADEGMKVLANLNDGDVTRSDISQFNEFMNDMTGRISQIQMGISRLGKAGSPEIAAKRDALQYKLTMLHQIRGAVKTGGATKTGEKTKQPVEEKDWKEEHKKKEAAQKRDAQEFHGSYTLEGCLAVLKILREGRDASKVMRAMGMDSKGEPVANAESRLSKLVMDGLRQKRSSSEYMSENRPMRRRSLAELSGRKKPQKPVISAKRSGFDVNRAQQLMLAAKQNQGK